MRLELGKLHQATHGRSVLRSGVAGHVAAIVPGLFAQLQCPSHIVFELLDNTLACRNCHLVRGQLHG
eukprot:7586007-Lingulodinium_polyedra.AAC.1